MGMTTRHFSDTQTIKMSGGSERSIDRFVNKNYENLSAIDNDSSPCTFLVDGVKILFDRMMDSLDERRDDIARLSLTSFETVSFSWESDFIEKDNNSNTVVLFDNNASEGVEVVAIRTII